MATTAAQVGHVLDRQAVFLYYYIFGRGYFLRSDFRALASMRLKDRKGLFGVLKEGKMTLKISGGCLC